MTKHSLYGEGISYGLLPDVERKKRKIVEEIGKEDRDEDDQEEREDNHEDVKTNMTATNVKYCTTEKGSHTAAWTPIRVRKVKLVTDGNLGLSPKSLKNLKFGKSKGKLKLKK